MMKEEVKKKNLFNLDDSFSYTVHKKINFSCNCIVYIIFEDLDLIIRIDLWNVLKILFTIRELINVGILINVIKY